MRLWTVMRTEIVRMTRTRAFYFVLFLLPFTLILILGNALEDAFSQEDRTIEPARVSVVLADGGALASGIRSFLDNKDMARYVTPAYVGTREEAEASVRAGDADFGLVVPAGFSESVLQGKPAEWEMMHGRDRLKNMTAENALGAFVRQTNAMQAIRIAMGGGPTASAGMTGTAPAGDTPVRIGSLNKEAKSVSALQYYAAAELIMFLLYAGMLAANSLAREKAGHTLERLAAMPVSSSTVIAGKMLGQGLLALLQAAVIIGGTAWLYGVDWGNRWGLLALVVVIAVIASMSMALLVSLLVKSGRAAIAAFQTVIIVMTLLSGGFTQIHGFLERAGHFTFSYWATDSVMRIMTGSELEPLLGGIGIMAAIGATLLAVSIGVFRKVGYR
ncbi:ABC transporter permease [Paenibacillus flagellatus]|uniref:ABC-2 type transporter transmembrane domain-containing protein n=1 Tax=Paenibacillus flagellatus TaxID=2211139 RepID=A0A2V5KS90_9BACL|nr:ABC transporter permease [Paenibacillus flagellatus]PYI54447.1 hypothetical protein DLM86_13345 [Paenibacillus flagellatus]